MRYRSTALFTLVVTGGLIAGLPGTAAAQQAGLKAGFNARAISFNPDFGTRSASESLIGVTGGLWVALPARGRLAVQIEALVARKGATELVRFGDSLKVTYLEVPVMLRVRDVLGSGAYLFAGPSVAFALSSTYEDDGVEEDAGDGLHDIDVGLTAGAGFEVRRLGVEARYTWGLRRVFQDGDAPEVKFRNRTFTVMAAFGWSR